MLELDNPEDPKTYTKATDEIPGNKSESKA
jgi:hypothetical protein